MALQPFWPKHHLVTRHKVFLKPIMCNWIHYHNNFHRVIELNHYCNVLWLSLVYWLEQTKKKGCKQIHTEAHSKLLFHTHQCRGEIWINKVGSCHLTVWCSPANYHIIMSRSTTDACLHSFRMHWQIGYTPFVLRGCECV